MPDESARAKAGCAKLLMLIEQSAATLSIVRELDETTRPALNHVLEGLATVRRRLVEVSNSIENLESRIGDLDKLTEQLEQGRVRPEDCRQAVAVLSELPSITEDAERWVYRCQELLSALVEKRTTSEG